MTLQQNGSNVTGTVFYHYEESSYTDRLTGTLVGTAINLTWTDTSETVHLSGTLTDSAHMSGTSTGTFTSGPVSNGNWAASKSCPLHL
jgi:hypothetical protein